MTQTAFWEHEFEAIFRQLHRDPLVQRLWDSHQPKDSEHDDWHDKKFEVTHSTDWKPELEFLSLKVGSAWQW